MAVRIRFAQPKDVKAIHSLILQLAEFENEPDSVIITEDQLLNDGFGESPSFFCLVAEKKEEIVGLALYYYCYSTWRGKYLYLEDLIVEASHRKQGIGSMLFERLIEQTKAEGLKQMGWQVLDWNEPAIRFYKKYQAKLDGEWLNGRFYF